MAVAPDLRRGPRPPRERVAGRRRPVGQQAQDLAEGRAELLGGLHLLTVARADEQVRPVGGERQAVAEVAAAGGGRLAPDGLDPGEAGGVAVDAQARAPDHGPGRRRVALDPAQVDGAVVGEGGPGHDVAEAALTRDPDLRRPGDLEAPPVRGVDQVERAAEFGDGEPGRPGEEGHRPRLVEPRPLGEGEAFVRHGSGGGRPGLGGARRRGDRPGRGARPGGAAGDGEGAGQPQGGRGDAADMP